MAKCASCGVEPAPKRCARCKAASYCSAACQTAHWQRGGHRGECARLSEELHSALGQSLSPAAAPAPARATEAGRGFLLGGLGGADVATLGARVELAPPVAQRTRRLVELSSSGALRAEASPGAGRCLVACRQAAAGDVLLQADCYATVTAETMTMDACSRCMARLPGGGARCKGCGTHFCAASCLEEAGPEHAAECPALVALKSFDGRLSSDLESVRLTLRVLARRAVQAVAGEGEVHWSDVDILLSHHEQVERKIPALSRSTSADGKLLLSILPPPVAKGITARDVASLLLRIKFNSHPIYDSGGTSRIGLGLYPVAALMNHACAFNAVCSFAPGGAVLNVRAVRAIEPGEHVCYAYIDPYQPRRTRRAQLRDAYFFDCACSQCSCHENSGGDTRGADRESTYTDAMMCAMRCGAGGRPGAAACDGILLLPSERLSVNVLSAPLEDGDEMSITCPACGAAHRVQELERCERAAEEILEHCGTLTQRDANEGRARLLQFLRHTPEAARLHSTHHIIYQAHMALAVASNTVGAIRERPLHLRSALDALLAWQRHGTSPEISKLYFSLGSALVASFRAAGGKAGSDSDLRESESLFSLAYVDSCICFGPGSLASRQAQAAMGKVQRLLGSSPATSGSLGAGRGCVSQDQSEIARATIWASDVAQGRDGRESTCAMERFVVIENGEVDGTAGGAHRRNASLEELD